MERFGSVGNFVSIEQSRSIFPWLVPLVSDRSVRLNGKHPHCHLKSCAPKRLNLGSLELDDRLKNE